MNDSKPADDVKQKVQIFCKNWSDKYKVKQIFRIIFVIAAIVLVCKYPFSDPVLKIEIILCMATAIIVIFFIAHFIGARRLKQLWEELQEEEENEKNRQYLSILRGEYSFAYFQKKIDECGGNFFLWKSVWNKMGVAPDTYSKDRDFLVNLGHIYVMALGKKKYNKGQYFARKEKAARYQNIKGFLYGVYNQKTAITGIAAYTGTGVLSVYASFFDDWIIFSSIVIAIILIIAFAGFIFLRSSYYDSEIELRKYGETWVRHEATIVNLEKVMMNYVMELDKFSCIGAGKGEKKLFMEQIGKVLMENEERFQKNMEKIQ